MTMRFLARFSLAMLILAVSRTGGEPGFVRGAVGQRPERRREADRPG